MMCPKCGKPYKGHTNTYGKVCMECWQIIPAPREPAITKENRQRFRLAQETIRDKLRGIIRSGNKPM